jgi:septum formation protein
MQRPTLVLASTSPYRRALLARLRLDFDVIAPPWQEVRSTDPEATARANAIGKARAAARLRSDAIIIASDQVAFCAGMILEKPGTYERACDQLAFLAGREHTLHTCVVVRSPNGAEREKVVLARLRMRPLAGDQVRAYVRLDAPLDCVGSYKSESLGVALFDRFDCEDPTAIEGLPLIATTRLLEEAGVEVLPRSVLA